MIKKIFKFILKIILTVVIVIAGMNLVTIFTTVNNVKDINDIQDFEADCVIVLGAAVWGTEPSPMLKQRIEKGVEVFEAGSADYLLMSGSGLSKNYNEPETMAKYAVNMGVDEELILKDYYGVRTYDSIWRAKYVYGYEKVIIVTQSYHLNRSIYIAKQLGMEAYGVACDKSIFSAGWYNNGREIIARCKDVIWCLLKLDPAYPE